MFYIFQIKKCQSDTCGYCVINPPRLPAEQFAELFFVPDPVTGDNTTYKDFSDVYGTFTTDNARPSLKDATQESQRDKQFKKLLTSGIYYLNIIKFEEKKTLMAIGSKAMIGASG